MSGEKLEMSGEALNNFAYSDFLFFLNTLAKHVLRQMIHSFLLVFLQIENVGRNDGIISLSASHLPGHATKFHFCFGQKSKNFIAFVRKIFNHIQKYFSWCL